MNCLKLMKQIGRRLDDLTDTWFGPSDVGGAFVKALKQAEQGALILSYDDGGEVTWQPDLAVPVTEALNFWFDDAVVEADQVRVAVKGALRAHLGFAGGAVVIWREGSLVRAERVSAALVDVSGLMDAARPEALN